MKITFRLLFLSAAMLCGSLLCLPWARAAEAKAAPPKDSQSLLIEMRLKRWNKELDLMADQQAKVKALLDEESKVVTKLDEDKSLTMKDRANKVEEIHQATYARIKPLLTAQQVPTFEKLTAKPKPKRKPAAAPDNP